MIILKLKKKFFTAKKVLFLEDVDTEKVLVSKKISSGEKKQNKTKSYKYLLGYLNNKPLQI